MDPIIYSLNYFQRLSLFYLQALMEYQFHAALKKAISKLLAFIPLFIPKHYWDDYFFLLKLDKMYDHCGMLFRELSYDH